VTRSKLSSSSFLSALPILPSLKYRKQLSGSYAWEIMSLIKAENPDFIKAALLIAVIV
jgi:hypothetical protein